MRLHLLLFSLVANAVTVLAQDTPANNNGSLYVPLYRAHSFRTPQFQNDSKINVNPLHKALLGHSINANDSLVKRQSDPKNGALPIGTCAPGTPCANGACCGKVRTQLLQQVYFWY
jgi:hypothetical protein